jgi:hypothetical protein
MIPMWHPSCPHRESPRHSRSRVPDCDRGNRVRPSFMLCLGLQVYRTSPRASRRLNALITSRSRLFLRRSPDWKGHLALWQAPGIVPSSRSAGLSIRSGPVYQTSKPVSVGSRVRRALATYGVGDSASPPNASPDAGLGILKLACISAKR